MKVLITGATGKVGNRLAKRLSRGGTTVRALVRSLDRASDLRPLGVELARGDLLDPASLVAAVRGVDAVVHCAAFFRGATDAQAHAVNDTGTRHLAHAAREASVRRFVFTSTGLVYGDAGGRLVDEEHPCAPTHAYPVSKLAAERFLLGFEGLDARVVRLPFVYGDGDPHIQETQQMMRPCAPTQRMSIGHHEDVARAIALVLAADSPAHRVFNVTDDEAPTLSTLFAAVGAQPPDGSAPERGAAFDAVLDGRRIREALGFAPRYARIADAVAANAL
ncbi:MAG: NAD-dependent epimerase/dehydratase family protein [Myxococcales bacterium]|nr:NAD-dependent epimerase/dehydratase family protein [Myxococcales bacterium]